MKYIVLATGQAAGNMDIGTATWQVGETGVQGKTFVKAKPAMPWGQTRDLPSCGSREKWLEQAEH